MRFATYLKRLHKPPVGHEPLVGKSTESSHHKFNIQPWFIGIVRTRDVVADWNWHQLMFFSLSSSSMDSVTDINVSPSPPQPGVNMGFLSHPLTISTQMRDGNSASPFQSPLHPFSNTVGAQELMRCSSPASSTCSSSSLEGLKDLPPFAQSQLATQSTTFHPLVKPQIKVKGSRLAVEKCSRMKHFFTFTKCLGTSNGGYLRYTVIVQLTLSYVLVVLRVINYVFSLCCRTSRCQTLRGIFHQRTSHHDVGQTDFR